jgi:hypothetical protein
MERQVAASQPAPINLNDLGNRLVEIWDGVDQDYIRHLTPCNFLNVLVLIFESFLYFTLFNVIYKTIY